MVFSFLEDHKKYFFDENLGDHTPYFDTSLQVMVVLCGFGCRGLAQNCTSHQQ